MLVPRQEYSRELKIACMRELDSGKGMAEVAPQYQLSLESERIAVLERKIGQQTMEIDILKKSLAAFQGASPGSRRQWRRRIYEQIQEAGAAEAGVNRLCQNHRSEPRRILPFSAPPAKYLRGPAAYNQCLVQQLDVLGRSHQ